MKEFKNIFKYEKMSQPLVTKLLDFQKMFKKMSQPLGTKTVPDPWDKIV